MLAPRHNGGAAGKTGEVGLASSLTSEIGYYYSEWALPRSYFFGPTARTIPTTAASVLRRNFYSEPSDNLSLKYIIYFFTLSIILTDCRRMTSLTDG